MDKEELRTDKAVEVSRKESYDLIAELLEELSDMFATQEQEVLTKKETLDNITPPIENNTMVRKRNTRNFTAGSTVISLFSLFVKNYDIKVYTFHT